MDSTEAPAELPASVPLVDVAAVVVAWHNRHPLASRIAPADVQSVGLVILPCASLPDTASPRATWWRRRWPWRETVRPIFSEDLVPEIGLRRMTAFARRHGLVRRPAGAEWPMRVAVIDMALSAAAKAAGCTQMCNWTLLTAAIEQGSRRQRLLIGTGSRPAVLGHRLWSQPRIIVGTSLVGAALVLAASLGWWMVAHRPGHLDVASKAALPAARPASAASHAATAASASASAVAAAIVAPNHAASVEASPITAASGAAEVAAPAGAQASTARPSTETHAGPLVGHASTADGDAFAASSPQRRPRPEVVRKVLVPLPSIRPQLAQAARMEASRVQAARDESAASPATHADARRTVPAAQPDQPIQPVQPVQPAQPKAQTQPHASSQASATQTTHFALVSAPLRSRAEAEAMLARLRVDLARIRHPVAVETTLQQTPQGWRVSWFPFATQRHAENARAALAAHRVQWDLVPF